MRECGSREAHADFAFALFRHSSLLFIPKMSELTVEEKIIMIKLLEQELDTHVYKLIKYQDEHYWQERYKTLESLLKKLKEDEC